jgi:hypothetical protein
MQRSHKLFTVSHLLLSHVDHNKRSCQVLWKERNHSVMYIFSPSQYIYCSLSEDMQQLCWRSLLTACSRYIQWYSSYFKFNQDWCLAPHRRGFYIVHSDAPQSVGLVWTSDQPVAETSTWQHTTLTTDRHPRPWWDSNPWSHQASGRRPTP